MGIDNLESAAVYINNTLVSRGYLKDSQRLEFASLKQPDHVGSAEEPSASSSHDIVKNDTRLINVIYGLLDSVDGDTRATEAQELKIKELSKEIEKLRLARDREIEKNKTLSLQVQRLTQRNSQLEGNMKLQQVAKQESQESFARLQSLVVTLKQQFANELRRRDLDIAKLKERLRDTARIKVYTGASGTLSKVLNSYGTAQRTTHIGASAGERQEINTGPNLGAKQQSIHPALSKDVAELNSKLTEENAVLLRLLYDVKAAVSSLTDDKSSLPLEFELSGPLDAAGVAVRITDAEALGSSISHCLDQIYHIIHSPNFVSISEVKGKEEEIGLLKQQLEETKNNWKAALQNVEEWKSYAEKRASSSTVPAPDAAIGAAVAATKDSRQTTAKNSSPRAPPNTVKPHQRLKQATQK